MAQEFQFSSVKVCHPNGLPASVGVAKSPHCCAHCGQPATIFTSEVNAKGKVSSQKLCLAHGLKIGVFHPKTWGMLSTPTSVQLASKKLASDVKDAKEEIVCSCGMHQSLFKSKGRAGCASCYTTFIADIKPVLLKIHPGQVHTGKAPRKVASRVDVRRRIHTLKVAMKVAIKDERYEQAAELRDQLKTLV